MLRDRFVLGLNDSDMQRKLFMEQSLTIKTAVDMARQNELIKSQMRSQPASVVVHEVNKSRGRQVQRGRGNNIGRGRGNHGNASGARPQVGAGYRGRGNAARSGAGGRDKSCDNCGYPRHRDGEKCPAWGKTCGHCNKQNHFRRKCKSREVHAAELDISEFNDNDPYFLGTVNCTDNTRAWYVTLPVCGGPVKFKIDTGADISTISPDTYRMLPNAPPLKPSVGRIVSLGGEVACNGIFVADSEYKDEIYKFEVAVVPSQYCLLGREVAAQMGLICRVDTMKTDEVDISLRDNVTPHCEHTPRRIAFPLMEKSKREIERMESEDIIERVTKPTDWCAGMVPVQKKNGDVRICVDLKNLNKSVRREHYPLQTLEDIAPQLSGSTVFTSLDAASGFWQVPLNQRSRELTTFITPFGRFMFKRLPFGINSATEIFQRKMMDLFRDEPGVEVIVDDILIHGRDQSEHDARLQRTLGILEKAGVVLNMAKCKFNKHELEYYGHVVGRDGVKPSPDKVKAILELKPPENITELRSINGMFQYLGKFVPHLSTVMKPVTELLKSDRAWVWGSVQQAAFDAAKELLTQSPTLAFYDASKKTVVSADASSYGLGAVLLQESEGNLKPVAYASRTLTNAERKYAQIEKECLAVTWACEKFSRYLVGLESFRLETDHKPLVPLINTKQLDETPVRCQRMLMRLMRFNPECVYVPGKQMTVADALSRKPLGDTEHNSLEEDIKLHVDSVISNQPMTDTRLQQIRDHTREDPVLRAAIVYTVSGWPKHQRDVPENLRSLFAVRNQLSVCDGLLTLGNRLVIPTQLRENILSKIHEGHLGVNKCLDRAGSTVWWPGITAQIKQLINSCHHCEIKHGTQRREPLYTTPLPDGPWQRVAADLCEYDNQDYLILTDYYSRWLEILHLRRAGGAKNTASGSVIAKFKDVFARFGVPYTIISDNGPQFQSHEFSEFAESYGFVHEPVSPRLPNSNGEAERGVETAKSILGTPDPWLSLMIYRNTAVAATGCSPTQLMLHRHIRTNLPALPSSLKPSLPDSDTVRETDQRAKEKYEHYYNTRHGVRPLQPLHPGDAVRLKLDDQKGWHRTGVVYGDATTPRSYIVKTDHDGRTLRRNRRHLKPYSPVVSNLPLSSDDPEPTIDTYLPHPLLTQVEPSPPPSRDEPKVETKPSVPVVPLKRAENPQPYITRSGREVKSPGRFDVWNLSMYIWYDLYWFGNPDMNANEHVVISYWGCNVDWTF